MVTKPCWKIKTDVHTFFEATEYVSKGHGNLVGQTRCMHTNAVVIVGSQYPRIP